MSIVGYNSDVILLLMGLMEDSFICRGNFHFKVPDDNIYYKYDLIEIQYNLLRFLTISYLDIQCLEMNFIYYFFMIEYSSCVDVV